MASVNTVQQLQKTRFSSLTLEQKIEIKNNGRPVPLLDIIQTSKCHNKEVKRKFKAEMYEKNEWICGCNATNRLFCFPCLLFGSENDKNWTKIGVVDLSHLVQKIKKHEHSKVHINAQLELSVLGKHDIRQQLNSAYRCSIEKHNVAVTRNRYVLSQIVNCIRFCGAFELALRGHDETNESLNPGIFRGLINFTSEIDSVLKEHLDKATVFKGTSKEIQNELLECMLEVCHERIKVEISQSEFVSVIADETTDVSSAFQMVILFRYVLPGGKPVERFWSFINPLGHDATALSSCIKGILSEVIDKSKLVSQSYDGASVMSGCHSGVQALIKNDYPYAYYVHCYAHQLNLILKQVTSQNTQVRIFFADLSEIPAFFANSPQRVAVLNEIVGRKIPRASSVRWNFNSRTVEVVYENREALIECLEVIESTSKQSTTISQARGLYLKIDQPVFLFWLEIFNRIMPHVDMLYNQLQKRTTDSVQVSNALSCFESVIKKVRDAVDSVAKEPVYLTHISKKRRQEDTYISRNIAAKEVCDVVITHAKERFTFTNHLLASNLFVSENFPQYEREFPFQFLEKSCEAYPFIDKSKLKTELEIIYMRSDFRQVRGAIHLLEFIIENNIHKTFSETFKLLKIIVTIPMTTAEAERCFSTLKRVKTFLRSTMSQDRLTSLAMLSLGKELIKSVVDFNEKVIDKFAMKKERKMDFLYKSTV